MPVEAPIAPAATQPKPAAAAPAPTPKPTPAPAPAKSESPKSEPVQRRDDAVDPELEAKFDAAFKIDKKEAPAESPKDEVKPAELARAPEAKEKGTPKEPKELRAEYDKVKTEAHTLKESLVQAEKKLQEAETKGKDVTVLTERVEKLQKDYEATQAELRAARQEVSPEFKAKHDKPFEQAIGSAQKALGRILITDPTTGEQRKVDFTKDFVPFYRAAAMEDGSIDFSKLKEVFGEADIVAKNHLVDLLRLNDARETALTEEKTQWKAKEEESRANKILSEKKQAEEREAFQKLRQDAFKTVEEQNAEWFGERADDDDFNAKLKEGREFAAKQPKTAQEVATLHAELFHRAAAHEAHVYEIKKLKEQLAERDSQIEEFRGSKPGQGILSSDAIQSDGEDFADGIRKMI